MSIKLFETVEKGEKKQWRADYGPVPDARDPEKHWAAELHLHPPRPYVFAPAPYYDSIESSLLLQVREYLRARSDDGVVKAVFV